jgi:predicted GIY-YIG superfamily endonuclease
MATVRKEIVVDVAIEEVWDAVRDFGALHERLAPGFVTDTRVDAEDRVVTFFNGSVLRERLISLSDTDRRLAWTIVDGPWTHHNGSVELYTEGRNRTRFVWTTDMLPHEAAEAIEQTIEHGMRIIHATLEGRSQKAVA